MYYYVKRKTFPLHTRSITGRRSAAGRKGGISLMKRFLSVFLLLAVLFAVAPGVARADEGYKPVDPYVLNFGDYADAYIYAQFSPFVPKLRYDGAEIDGYSIIFGLHDTYNNKPFETLYCTDLPVDATVGSNYRRINLSDSTYASAVADRLRAIVLGTYPYIDVDTLAQSSGITGLSLGEAITGSQLAIWQVAHGESMRVEDFLSFVTYGNSKSSEIQDKLDAEHAAYNAGDAAYRAAVKARVESLYHYLLSLDAVAPKKVVVSERAFLSRSTQPLLARKADGSVDITVEATVNVTRDEGDTLALTAYLPGGQYYTTVSLQNGVSTHSLTISGVPAALAQEDVMLAIDGYQNADDVFLMDAEGIRGTSQSMIGVYAGLLPVHAEVMAAPDRLLNIFKHDGSNGPLENISFNVYYVGTVEDFRNGRLNLGSVPTDADIAAYAVPERLVGTLTTDANGQASLNFGATDGVYLVKELPNAAVVSGVSPFFVSLPDYSRLDANGEPTYVITASPKNTVRREEVEIKKDVTALDQEHDTFAVGETHTWIIRASLPATLETGKSYTITDTLDYRLTYVDFAQALLAKTDGTQEQLLTRDRDYKIALEKATDAADHEVDRLTISLTRTGMQRVAQQAGTATADYELRFHFTAQINRNAAMGETIENQAHLVFTNNVGRSFEADSDKPEVHTGGASLIKTDSASGAALAGASFSVYREATQAEITAGGCTQVTIGGTLHTLTQVPFYSTPDLTGDPVTSLTTGADGLGYFYGLAYGDYYLLETKAPDGYVRLSAPIAFAVNAASHTEAQRIAVKNAAGTLLPETGGTGTALYTLSGLLLLGLAALLLARRRQRA